MTPNIPLCVIDRSIGVRPFMLHIYATLVRPLW